MDPVLNVYTIDGYSVNFPYKAYDCQITYMEKVLYSLKHRKHALLESPTGTGKTMCLLASTLAFQRDCIVKYNLTRKLNNSCEVDRNLKTTGTSNLYEEEHTKIEIDKSYNLNEEHGDSNLKKQKSEFILPRIIYSSRTHSQLSQVMRELRSSKIVEALWKNLNDLNIENSLRQDSPTNKKQRNTMKNPGNKLFKATILGSRDQLCVHPKISKYRGSALVKNCRKTTKEGKCRYHNNLKQANMTGIAGDIEDIEDLKRIASTDSGYFCPFYATREIANICNVILLPYNYLLDSITRQNLKLDLNNTIIILDEAHNVESVAEEAYSYDLRDIDLALSQKAIQNMLEAARSGLLKERESDKKEDDISISFDIEIAIHLATSVYELSKLIRDIPCKVPNNRNERIRSKLGDVEGTIFPGSYIHTLFKSAGFTIDKFQNMDECLTSMINFGQGLSGNISDLSSLSDITPIQLNARIGALERFQRCLRLTFNTCAVSNPQWFKVYVHYEISQQNGLNSEESIDINRDIDTEYDGNYYNLCLSFWCFSPAAALTSLVSSGVRSLIVTSGTLSPLDTLAQQFSCANFSFEVFLENDHVINGNEQLWVAAIEQGAPENKTQLIGSFESRSNPAYFEALGSTVLDSVKRIPGGVLLFFASYTLMDQAINLWTIQGLMDRIKALKSVFVEPRNSYELNSILESYKGCIELKSKNNVKSNSLDKLTDFTNITKKCANFGSLLIAVCRGKISEGIDFSDDTCRGVIIAGMPFPSIADPRVCLKKQYMDEYRMDSRRWYNQQAIRAVNQAVGRVVRHRLDYGAVIFADKRFTHTNIRNQLSKWLRGYIRCLEYLNTTNLNSISTFFNRDLHNKLIGNSNNLNDNKLDLLSNKVDESIRSNINTTSDKKLCIPIVGNNLKNEVTNLLQQLPQNNVENTQCLTIIENKELNQNIHNNIRTINIPWKKSKIDSSVNCTKYDEQKVHFNFVPISSPNKNLGRTDKKGSLLFDKAKSTLTIEEYLNLKSYLFNLDNLNSTILVKIVDCFLPDHITDYKTFNERSILARNFQIFIPEHFKMVYISFINNKATSFEICKDKALLNALESQNE
ncbi:DNA repair helicase family protein [Cryptosporidium muris RN66]|uniref:DNA repair helicase family protein n=1 Tax=Cryptosporidium muris (strain RN66) TaxID=441375 RepID=B6ADD7_CRYMR|nr:DNA repair helicase family protein [Cryptosporidium muris RN66]EEA06228.1 DNA repair helicase family protein [Cryptosporidium muris RN66]|eukprot:XP_002140577.1 DNA repair helicase family protein [Cryptosporidium muris RN66]